MKRNYHYITRLRRKGSLRVDVFAKRRGGYKVSKDTLKEKGWEKGRGRKESRDFSTLATFPETRISILACLFKLLVRFFFPRERQKSKTKRYHKNRLTSSQDDSSAPGTWYPEERPLWSIGFFIVFEARRYRVFPPRVEIYFYIMKILM